MLTGVDAVLSVMALISFDAISTSAGVITTKVDATSAGFSVVLAGAGVIFAVSRLEELRGSTFTSSVLLGVFSAADSIAGLATFNVEWLDLILSPHFEGVISFARA